MEQLSAPGIAEEHPILPSPDDSETFPPPEPSAGVKPLISQPVTRSFTPALPNPSLCWEGAC